MEGQQWLLTVFKLLLSYTILLVFSFKRLQGAVKSLFLSSACLSSNLRLSESRLQVLHIRGFLSSNPEFSTFLPLHLILSHLSLLSFKTLLSSPSRCIPLPFSRSQGLTCLFVYFSVSYSSIPSPCDSLTSFRLPLPLFCLPPHDESLQE